MARRDEDLDEDDGVGLDAPAHIHFDATLSFAVALKRSRCLAFVHEIFVLRRQPIWLAVCLWIASVFVVVQYVTDLSVLAILVWAAVALVAIARFVPVKMDVDAFLGTETQYDWLKDVLEMMFFFINSIGRWVQEASTLANPGGAIALGAGVWILGVVPSSWIFAGLFAVGLIRLF